MRAVLRNTVAAIGSRALLSVALALSPLATSAGDWLPYGAANGGRAVSTHPTIAGQALISAWMEEQKTFFTGDGGAHWSGNPGSTIFYDRPRLSGSIGWVTWNRFLYRTTDQGRTWTSVPVPPTYSVSIAGVNPANADEIVLTAGLNVFHSTNAGATWSSDTPPMPVSSAAVDWSTRRLYAVSPSQSAILRRPLDAPGTWQSLPASATMIAAGHGRVIYASTNQPYPQKGALYLSTDQGATFAKVAETFADNGRFNDIAFTSSPSRIYALDDRHVLRSDNGGASWTDGAFLPGLEDFFSYPHLDADAAVPDRLYVATPGGVLASVDAGATFSLPDRATGAPGRSRSIAVDAMDPSRQWLVAPHLYYLEKLLERTADGGATWTVLDTGEYPIAASRQRSNTLFAFGAIGTLRVSIDGGTTWTTAFDPFPETGYNFRTLAQGGQPPIVALAGEADTSSFGLHVSTDDGQSFTPRSTPPRSIRQLAVAPSSSSTLYASAHPAVLTDPILWRSTDGAATWHAAGTFTPRITGGSFNDVYAIAIDPRDPARVYVGLAFPDNLMRSDDGGVTWTRTTTGLGAGAVMSLTIDPAQPDTLYAAVYLSGVFRSTNRGATWTVLDAGLRDDSVRQVLLDPHRPGRLYAATNTGVYSVDLGSGLPAGRRRAVEFHHAGYNHYFSSADVDEIAGLDAGVFEGWLRTGQGMRVAEPPEAGNLPTCRFFSTGFGPVSTHFYTPYVQECEDLKTNPAWLYEKIAFGLALPDPATHGCAPGTRALYRLWNRNFGGAPNHRYTTTSSVLDPMISAGWLYEGDFPTRVFACVPS